MRAPGAAAKIPPLVEGSWLEPRLGESDLRILDATVQVKLTPFPHMRSGEPEHKREHVPGASFVELRSVHDPRAPARTFTMPRDDWFATAIGRLGVGDSARVVLYDRRESMWAARLWWMLKAFGFDNAAILNGGWTAWRLEGHPTSRARSAYPPATFTPNRRSGLFASKDDVLQAIDDPDTCIVSALGHRQFRGERREYGRRRGHIPGARNVSAWQILDRHTQRYRPLDELRELFGEILDAKRIITYCGGGIASASVAFVLHVLGHPNVAVYDGGLIEWSADRRLPLVTGDELAGRAG